MTGPAIRTWGAVLVVIVTLVAATSAEEPGWQRVTGPPVLEFPRDHGAHADYRTEWWYLTGLVTDEKDRRYGFQVTFFRQGLAPGEPGPESSRLRARQIVAAHMAVADLATGRFVHAERIRRTGGGLAGYSTTDLEVWLDDWRMARRDDGSLTVFARDPETAIGLDLGLRPTREVVLHGEGGYSKKGAEDGNASVYLSWTRLEVAGTIEVDGEQRTVEGAAWFDHEWGTSTLGAGVVGWDWFSLRLGDGRDLMVFRLRRGDGSADPRSSGTLVEATGELTHLKRDEIEVKVLEHWQSPETGARYPTRWKVRVPSASIDLDVLALLASSELDGTATTGVVYWEGPVEAQGSSFGEGYVEMTGYAGTLEGRF